VSWCSASSARPVPTQLPPSVHQERPARSWGGCYWVWDVLWSLVDDSTLSAVIVAPSSELSCVVLCCYSGEQVVASHAAPRAIAGLNKMVTRLDPYRCIVLYTFNNTSCCKLGQFLFWCCTLLFLCGRNLFVFLRIVFNTVLLVFCCYSVLWPQISNKYLLTYIMLGYWCCRILVNGVESLCLSDLLMTFTDWHQFIEFF